MTAFCFEGGMYVNIRLHVKIRLPSFMQIFPITFIIKLFLKWRFRFFTANTELNDENIVCLRKSEVYAKNKTKQKTPKKQQYLM